MNFLIDKKKFNFEHITILSNGYENPVVNELIKLYPKIHYTEGTIQEAISLIIYAYNFVMPISTFPQTLIWLNDNLKNLYIYELRKYRLRRNNYMLHKMKPSKKYLKVMKEKKWQGSYEQLKLMINENCINSKIESIKF